MTSTNTLNAQFTPPTLDEMKQKFPQYEMRCFIAQGGMGAVYLARRTSLDRPVAIKILPAEFSKDEGYREAFHKEAKAMAKLNHTNLANLYDYGEVDNLLYITMEFVNGVNSLDLANGQKMEPVKATEIILKICDGLQHAHENEIIHRDIKPANILISHRGVPKLVDFGLARPLNEGESHDKEPMGTLGYSAPEITRDRDAVDHRSDIYSTGIILYELLTGQLPDMPRALASSLSDCGLEFDTVIRKALHPDHNERYQSVTEFRDDLVELLNQLQSDSNLVFISSEQVEPIEMKQSESSEEKFIPQIISKITIAASIMAFFLGASCYKVKSSEIVPSKALIAVNTFDKQPVVEMSFAEEQSLLELVTSAAPEFTNSINSKVDTYISSFKTLLADVESSYAEKLQVVKIDDAITAYLTRVITDNKTDLDSKRAKVEILQEMFLIIDGYIKVKCEKI